MRKNIAFIILIIGAIYSLKAQTQTQDLNMGLHQLQFPSANGGFNRIHSFGGTFPGKWLFKSRFDHIYLDAGENENNKYSILFLSGGIERARLNGAGNFGIGTSNPVEKLHVEGSLLLDAYQLGNQKGLFFREGFSTSNKYNLSILTYDDGDNSPDALDINAYDGIYFNTGSNSRNPRMTIKGNGNVGIGTTNPEEKLQIKDLNTTPIVNITGKAPNTGNDELVSEIRLSNLYDNLPGHRASIKAISDKSGSHGNVAFQFNTSIWNGNHSEINALRIASNGNVGIGTTNPNSSLHIRNANGTGSLIVQGKQDATVGNSAEIILSTEHSTANNTSGTNTGRKAIIKAVANSNWGQNTRLGFYTSSDISSYPVERMTVSPNGNVGIGTINTQGYKLGVKGKIAAEEVKVALYNDWPDYVFEEDYHLPSLQEVEHHISEKGHLENIPSAAEVAENGIQLGEMNKKLLEKIEQLTLYMIEQNKKTEQLIKKSEMLQEEINLLKQQVKR
ncbi:hypothetical protein [Aquimarina sp. 433]